MDVNHYDDEWYLLYDAWFENGYRDGFNGNPLSYAGRAKNEFNPVWKWGWETGNRDRNA